jgi:hypothetical protein
MSQPYVPHVEVAGTSSAVGALLVLLGCVGAAAMLMNLATRWLG